MMNEQILEKNVKIMFFLNILRKGAGMINREAAFAEELNKNGYKVSILSYFKPEMIMSPGISVNCVYPTRYIEKFYSHPLGHFYAFFKIFLVLLWVRPKVILVDLPGEAEWACLFRKLFKFKVIFSYHGVACHKFYKGDTAQKLLEIKKQGHEMLKSVDQALVVSDFLLSELNDINVSAFRLYNGVKEDQFYVDERIKKDPNKIVFIGRFTEYKGALNIVHSFSMVAPEFPELTLDLYGYPESEKYMEEIKKFIIKKHLSQRIKIYGPIGQEKMRAVMNEAGIFINGSTDETFCMPLLEAQACGTPCVAFSAGGIPEVLIDGKTGLLAEPDNVKDMAGKIKQLVSDKAFYNLCKFNTRLHVENFKYKKLVTQLVDHIQGILLRGRIKQ